MFVAGAVITHINSTDVRELPIKEIGAIIKSSEKLAHTQNPSLLLTVWPFDLKLTSTMANCLTRTNCVRCIP